MFLGHFCPQATSEPLACTPGSYGNTTGLQLSSDCTSCDGGMHCNRYGLTRPSGLCSASFYCIEGSSSSTPGWNTGRNATSAGGVCFPGAYCPAGTVYPIVSNTFILIA